MIAAWELDELPDDWIDAALVLTDEFEEIKAAQQKIETSRAAWLKRMEYRSYLN